MRIPFTKAHGARNDFLLTWRADLPEIQDFAALARALCDRYTGPGADGWILLSQTRDADAAMELFNSDGSRAEISGNGTRCVAAMLMTASGVVRIRTGAGCKELRLLCRIGPKLSMEMNMGRASIEHLNKRIHGQDAVVLNVGNPQCAAFVQELPENWPHIGASIEADPFFPNRTNVSFVRVLDRHTLDVRFFERGAGVTMSSGTGSTGAAAAAMARGLVESPVEIRTPAGPLTARWQAEEILLAGPAEILGRGEFYYL